MMWTSSLFVEQVPFLPFLRLNFLFCESGDLVIRKSGWERSNEKFAKALLMLINYYVNQHK